MPKKGGKRKKRRTHVVVAEEDQVKVPKSMVIPSPNTKLGRSVLDLMADIKAVMNPYTATKLKLKKNNSVKDFIQMAAPFGVTHLVLLGQSSTHTNIRIACTPKGPTLSFQVQSYSLGKDVRSLQKKPIDFSAAMKTSPLVVLNNFSRDVMHQKLAATTFQNMFPAINVQVIKLKECRRVVLYDYNNEKDEIEFRHFAIRAVPTGINKSVKKLITANIPNLGNAEDVADAILGNDPSSLGYGSDSDYEDEENCLVLPENYSGKGNKKANKSAIRLAEIGPRITLKLVKVQDDICKGEVLYHAFQSKDVAEATRLRILQENKEKKKLERIAIQTANVEKKLKLKEEKLKLKKEKYQHKTTIDNEDEENEEEKEEEVNEEEEEVNHVKNVAMEDEDDDDLEWYRTETGSEPTDEMKHSAQIKQRQKKENDDEKASRPIKKPYQQRKDKDQTPSSEPKSGPKGWSRKSSGGGGVKRKAGGMFDSSDRNSKRRK